MASLHDISIYWLPEVKRWVVKVSSMEKPIIRGKRKVSRLTVQRLFLTKTAFHGLKAKFDEVQCDYDNKN